MFRAKILRADGGAARGRKVDGASARSYDIGIFSRLELTGVPLHQLQAGYFLRSPGLRQSGTKSAAFPDVRKAALRLAGGVSFRSL